MDTRYYPLKEVDFIKEVELYSTLPYKRSGGRAVISHYSFFCAVLYVLRTGVSWHDVPSCYGSWYTIYTRFKRWNEKGIFGFLVHQLQQKKKITVDISWVDSTTMEIHRHGAGALKKKGPQALGRKGVGTKIHGGLWPDKSKELVSLQAI